MNLVSTIIIEDELESQLVLARMIETNCKSLKLDGVFSNVISAVEYIKNANVDLIFLDIELPGESGFSLFSYFPNPKFHVIFTTAFNDHAVKAFKFSAVDFILKPVDLNDLLDAVVKFDRLYYLNNLEHNYRALISNLQLKDKKRFAVNHQSGFDLVELDDILWLQADINYTIIHLKSGGNVTIAKTLKLFEDYLDPEKFIRISRSAMVNINYITKFNKHNSLQITLIDKSVLPVSESRREELLSLYEKI